MGKSKKSGNFEYYTKSGKIGNLMDRFGVEGTKMNHPDGRSNGEIGHRSREDVDKDIAKAMMNDYDYRRSMEAAAMAGNKDAKKFAKKGFKGGNIYDAADVMADLKKEYVGGGGMNGAKNRAGLTHALVQADREAQTASYDEKYATKKDLDALQQKEAAQEAFDDAEVELSPEMQAAKDRAAAWTESDGGGDVYGASSVDDEQDTSAVTPVDTQSYEAGQSYLSGFKDKLRSKGKFVSTL